MLIANIIAQIIMTLTSINMALNAEHHSDLGEIKTGLNPYGSLRLVSVVF